MTIPEQIVATMTSATEEVFSTMVFKDLVRGTPVFGEELRPESNVVATVAFAGPRSGLVSIHASRDTAHDIAAAMLGVPVAAVNGQMPDAIGEIANMIAGTLRTRMAAFEPAWAISVPTVTIGSDFRTRYVTEVSRVVCPFQMEGDRLWVELILTGS